MSVRTVRSSCFFIFLLQFDVKISFADVFVSFSRPRWTSVVVHHFVSCEFSVCCCLFIDDCADKNPHTNGSLAWLPSNRGRGYQEGLSVSCSAGLSWPLIRCYGTQMFTVSTRFSIKALIQIKEEDRTQRNAADGVSSLLSHSLFFLL